MLQKNVMHRAENKRICMVIGRYILNSHRASRAFIVNRRKLSWFGHVCCHDMLLKIILQGTVDGSRRRWRPRKSWKDHVRKWTGQPIVLLRKMPTVVWKRALTIEEPGKCKIYDFGKLTLKLETFTFKYFNNHRAVFDDCFSYDIFLCINYEYQFICIYFSQ